MRFLCFFNLLVLARAVSARELSPFGSDLANELTRHREPPIGLPQIGADPPTQQELWQKAKCTGEQLYDAMISDANSAAKHIQQSPYDGKMIKELESWGYFDATVTGRDEHLCDFDDFHGLKDVFDKLGWDPRSSRRGGPNKCYSVEHSPDPLSETDEEHYKGPDGKEYRYTEAHYTIGINSKNGVVYFIDLESPREAAKDAWDEPDPKPEELPAIRASSDVAWAFWNRSVNQFLLSHINVIMSLTIINKQTMDIIRKAFEGVPTPPGQTGPGPWVWPGTDFPVNGIDEAGLALLGSPNGRAGGFFLAQHKRQLGERKTIYKITIFKPTGRSLSMMMMWVKDSNPSRAEEGPATSQIERVKKTRDLNTGGGQNYVREHIFWAKL